MIASLFSEADRDQMCSADVAAPSWQYVRFDEVTIIGTGQVSPLVEPYRSYFYIGPENIEAESGTILGLRRAGELGLISGKYLFDAASIIYSKIRPNLNKVCQPDFVGVCSADTYPIWPKEDVVVKGYLAHYMRSAAFVKQAVAASMRSGMPKVNREDIAPIRLMLPPLPEQRRIVEILDEADAAVRTTEALIAAKLKHKRAWAERLLTGRTRFPEFVGEAWQTHRLAQLFTERVETKRPDLELLAVTGGEGIIKRDALARRDTSNLDKSKYLRVAPGDIAYNTMRMWQGVFGLSGLEGIVSPAYTVCTPRYGLVDGRYIEQMFKMPAQIAKFHQYSQGLVKDTLNLKFPAFSRIEVTIPELIEQRKIADVLGLMDEEITLRRRQLAALKAQKQGLMQKLLTGEVRVKEFAP